jgi:gluconate 2-dehydrogenase subunit 3-like protein
VELTRRRVLSFGLGGAVLLACGGALGSLSTGYALAPGDAAIGLTVQQLAIVRALVEALFPADGDLPAGLDLGLHQRIDREVWASSDVLRSDLRSAVSLLEYAPLLYGFGHRFTRLDPPAREAAVRALLDRGPKPVVQAVVALKQLCSLLYYAHPSTWPAVGYDGPWVPEKPPESTLRYEQLLEAARGSA